MKIAEIAYLSNSQGIWAAFMRQKTAAPVM